MKRAALIGFLLLAALAISAVGQDKPLSVVYSHVLGNSVFPDHMAMDQSGIIWLSDSNLNNHSIYRFDAQGDMSVFDLGPDLEIESTVAGENGQMWGIGRSKPKFGVSTPGEDPLVRIDEDGSVHQFPTADSSLPGAIVLGSDKRPWFEDFNTGAFYELGADNVVRKIAADDGADIFTLVLGADGNIWFGDTKRSQVGRITAAGVVTLFPTPGKNAYPSDLVTGPDGFIWVAESQRNAITRVSLDGSFQEYQIPFTNAWPRSPTFDAQGNLWFVEPRRNRVARMTRGGTFDDWPLPGQNVLPTQVLVDKKGRIWVASSAADFQDDPKLTYSPSTVFCFKAPG
jgi:virginiamycin B lyase